MNYFTKEELECIYHCILFCYKEHANDTYTKLLDKIKPMIINRSEPCEHNHEYVRVQTMNIHEWENDIYFKCLICGDKIRL